MTFIKSLWLFAILVTNYHLRDRSIFPLILTGTDIKNITFTPENQLNLLFLDFMKNLY